MRLLKILFLTILVLFPFGELLRFNVGSNIYIKPLDIIVGLTVFWCAILFLKHKRQQRQKIPWYFAFFPVIGLISLLVHTPLLHSSEVLTSFLYWLRWVAYVGIIFVVQRFDEDFKHLLRGMLLIVGMFVLLFGFLQYFFYHDIRHLIYIGWDDHMYRLFATFFDPNFAGAFFVLFFVYVAGLLLEYSPSRSPSATLKVSNIKDRMTWESLLLSLLLIITLIAVFLTFSRSALLMLVVSSFIFLYFINMKRIILILLGIIMLFVVAVSPFFAIENVNLLRTTSIEARFVAANNALRVIADHPLLGVGFDSYRYAQEDYGFLSKMPMYPANAGAGTDNSWLFVFATTGVVGFSLYVYFWYRLLRHAFTLRHDTILAKVFLASSSGLFINAFFINSLFFAPIMLWIWILYGLLIKKE